MEKYPVHNLASICQRMPLNVYVYVTVGDGVFPIRAIKSELVDLLREMDGRTKVYAALNLDGIYLQFE